MLLVVVGVLSAVWWVPQAVTVWRRTGRGGLLSAGASAGESAGELAARVSGVSAVTWGLVTASLGMWAVWAAVSGWWVACRWRSRG